VQIARLFPEKTMKIVKFKTLITSVPGLFFGPFFLNWVFFQEEFKYPISFGKNSQKVSDMNLKCVAPLFPF